MKKNPLIVAWFFIFVLLFNSIQTGIMLGFYMVDTGSFVELFCVNKDKPELQCNGKCELAKLTPQKDNSENPAYLDFLHPDVVMYLFDGISFSFQLITPIEKPLFYYKNHYSFFYKKTLDHPPTVLS